MAFAAAVAAARSSRTGQGAPPPCFSQGRPYGLPPPGPGRVKMQERRRNSGRSALTTLASCGCVGFAVAGVSLLIDSLTDERGVLVQEYNEEVSGWTKTMRKEFASITIEATATYTPAVSSTAPADQDAPQLQAEPPETVVRTLSLEAVSSEEESLQDVENNEGLEDYTALFYRSTLRLPSYYQGFETRKKNSLYGAPYTSADLLPSEEVASTVKVVFRITTRNGQAFDLSLGSAPVAFDQSVIARTPAPDKKCRQEQHGIWFSQHCHVAKRLNRLCVQVQQNKAGAWTFKDAVEGNPAGCHFSQDWSPAEYVVDKCWGRATEACEAAGDSDHEVEVIVRSGEDPIIYASHLVGPSLSFGWSKHSQRSFGIVFLSLGLLFGVVPLCHLWDECVKQRRRRQNDSDEDGERRNLRFSNIDADSWNISMPSETPTSPPGVLVGRSPHQGMYPDDDWPQPRKNQVWAAEQ